MNNEEKNTYATGQIVRATFALLEGRELNELSINEITATAMVSRNAFYRNFKSREDIVLLRLRQLQRQWVERQRSESPESDAEFYRALFSHLENNKELYLLLKKRDLFYLFQQVLLDEFGPKKEQDNRRAYMDAYVAYGTFGWIEEWISRGMQESGDEMADYLLRHGLK